MSRESRHRTEAALAAVVALAIRHLPRPLVLVLGRALGRLWASLDGRHRAIAADNLRRAFPDWGEPRVQATARRVYQHFGAVLLDLLWLEGCPVDRLLRLAEVEGVEHLHAALRAGRGVVTPTAHFGNWEYQGIASARLIGPFSVVARPLDNPALDRRLVSLRTRTGNAVIYKKRALTQVMKAIRDGGLVAIVIDQNVQEKDGIFVDFFGRPACTTTVAAALALKTGCAIVPGRCALRRNGRYHMVYGPPIDWKSSGRRDQDLAGLTQHLTSVIESWIRDEPDQWLWLHRRWKTQPARDTAAIAATAGPAVARGDLA